MIEVVTLVGGNVRDRAEASDEAGAVCAARQLCREAVDAGCGPTFVQAAFYLDGEHLRTVPRSSL